LRQINAYRRILWRQKPALYILSCPISEARY
jgi:hypothetical protein